MRSHPGSYRLSFMLPTGVSIDRAVASAVCADPEFIVAGCTVRLSLPLVKIAGPSRDAVFDATAVLLQRGWSAAALVQSPGPAAGTDSWSIIVGANVAFSPTSLDPHFPRATKV
jgi:hypothetical protein